MRWLALSLLRLALTDLHWGFYSYYRVSTGRFILIHALQQAASHITSLTLFITNVNTKHSYAWRAGRQRCPKAALTTDITGIRRLTLLRSHRGKCNRPRRLHRRESGQLPLLKFARITRLLCLALQGQNPPPPPFRLRFFAWHLFVSLRPAPAKSLKAPTVRAPAQLQKPGRPLPRWLIAMPLM